MKLPEKKWLTINELAIRWIKYGVGQTDILHYMETGELSAWLNVKETYKLERLHFDENWNVINRTPCLESGDGSDLFKILFFNKIVWKNIEGTLLADFYKLGIVLVGKSGKAYRFRSGFVVIRDNDLLVMMDDIIKFEQAESSEEEKSLIPLQEPEEQLLPSHQSLVASPPVPLSLPTDSTGREMLPLRLIPFITNGNTGPERLALVLAEKGDLSGYKEIDAQGKLKAYRLLDGNLICMKRAEWDDHLHAIQSLRESCEQKHKDYTKWRLKALKLLPPAFVWRDEFEKAHSHSMLPGDHEQQELNWYPCFPEDVDTAFLMKVGTESPAADIEQTDKPVNAPPVTSFLNPAPDPCHLVTKTLEQLTVPLAPAAEVEQSVKEEGPVLSGLGLMKQKAKAALFNEYADYHTEKSNKHRCLIAVDLKEAGATYSFIGRLWGASRPGEDKSTPSHRGTELVKEGLEMLKKMKVKS